MIECPKSPSGEHQWVKGVCLWCGTTQSGQTFVEDEKAVCEDFIRKIKETSQAYIVDHDVPISISKKLYDMLDERRREVARRKKIPLVQYEWEDFFFDWLAETVRRML